MNKLIFSLIFALGSTLTWAQTSDADAILGTWLNEQEDAKIEVYKEKNKYYGKIIWLKNDKNDDGSSPKLDSRNPDPKLKVRPIIGTIILKDLIWDKPDNEWDDGEIYDPKSGNTYSLYAKLQNANSLFLKGYIGFAVIGRSTIWSRVK